jgi:hypothetical protein
MKQFKLSRQTPGATLTKFFIYDGNDIIGSVNVANEDAADLEKHWLGGAQPKAPAALATPAGGKPQNPAVSAMLAVARKNRLSKTAILRGC